MSAPVKKVTSAIKFSTLIVSVLWIVHLYKHLTFKPLTTYGIFPREADGLIGILTAPLVHGSWEHLISNSVPLFVTSTIIYFFYKRTALAAFFLIYVFTGAAVWMFGRSVYHIGASGVVYGLIAYIFWSGIFRRNIKSIVLALIVTLLYSGYFYGVLPTQEGISWESHLLGAIVGIVIAWVFKGLVEKDEVREDPWAHEAKEEKAYFLPRDTFDKTIEERNSELWD